MNWLISLVLMISTSQSFASFAQPGPEEISTSIESDQEREIRLLIYKTHENAIQFVNAANLAQMKGLRTCLCQHAAAHGERIKECSSNEIEIAEFDKVFITGQGEKRLEKVSCNEISVSFLEQTKQAFESTRLSLALATPQLRTDSPNHFILRPATLETYRRDIKSPFDFATSHAPLTVEEIKLIKSELSRFRSEVCEKILLANLDVAYANPIETCFQLTSGHGPRASENLRLFKRELASYRKIYLNSYLERIKANNIILYMPEAIFSMNGVIAALDRMLANAVKRGAPRILNDYAVYKSDWAVPYTKAILNRYRPDLDDLDERVARMHSTGELQQHVVTAAEFSAVIGATVLCQFLPSGRPVALLMRLLSAKGCTMFVGASSGLYFLGDAVLNRRRILEFYLSSLESSKTRVQADGLLSVKTQVSLAILTLPLLLK